MNDMETFGQVADATAQILLSHFTSGNIAYGQVRQLGIDFADYFEANAPFHFDREAFMDTVVGNEHIDPAFEFDEDGIGRK